MPFQYILANLLAQSPAAAAVMFVDDTGEPVDLATSDFEPFDVQVVGAYLGIYLRQTRSAFDAVGLGTPAAMEIRHQNLNIHLRTLPDGYFLALVQGADGDFGRVRHLMSRAARELGRELFGE